MKKLVAALLMVSMVLSLAACGTKENKNGSSATASPNATASASATASAGQETKVKTLKDGILQIGMEVGYPPFEYFDADGKTILGFDAQLAKAIGEKLGLEVEFINTAWDGIFGGVDTKRYDCIISACTITPERKEKYAFSRPYVGNAQSMVLLKDSKVTAKKPEELTGLKVGYQNETTSDIYLQGLTKNGLEFKAQEYKKVLNCFDDLKFKRIDAVVCDKLVAVDYVNKENSPFQMVWEGPTSETFGVCIKKDNTELQTAINKALNELFDEGKLTQISNDVFKTDMTSSVKDIKE